MRITTFLLLIIASVYTYGQTGNPFLSLKYDKVIFYDFEENGDKGSLIVDDNGKQLQKIIKHATIDNTTAKSLNTKLGDKKSFGNGTASCFDPHCGFVYFLKNKPVAQISICLGCNRLRSSLDLPAQKQGKQGKGEQTYYYLNGLSKSFRKFINDLLIKNNFSNQIQPGSYFDE